MARQPLCARRLLLNRHLPAPMSDLPFSPSTQLYSGAACAGGDLVELGWEPDDGVEFGAFLRPWFTNAALRGAAHPIILTLENVKGKWRPSTLTAESLAVPGEI